MIPDKVYIKMFSYGVGYVTSSEEKLKDEGIEYIRKEALIDYMGKISMAVNSFSKDTANTFRAEGANKLISLITEYLENL